jgi:glycosyltransferase involved in cell wall biosynthesis
MIPKSGDRFSDQIMRQPNMPAALDIVIPVYNEGRNIVNTLVALKRDLRTPFRVLICYDRPDDDTLTAIRDHAETLAGVDIALVLNRSRGAHGAVLSGFAASTAPFVMMYPADDDYNAAMLNTMVEKAQEGYDVVCASRFMRGGCMVGCPVLKSLLVRAANLTLFHIARLPTHDASNGFRLFSRRVLDSIAIESEQGFSYSIELLVKAHRLGWRIAEVPAQWYERQHGTSRFRIIRWLPAYARWYRYAFATTFLRQGPDTVPMKADPGERLAAVAVRHG